MAHASRAEARKTRLKTQKGTHCFHFEDVVRRRAFASMGVRAAAMGCAIALLTSRFGHLVVIALMEVNIRKRIWERKA